MGEAKQEETKTEAKPAEEKKEEKAEEKKEEAKPSLPPSIILSMDLHCVGCAKKIERCILKCRGVEEVETDIEQNKVTVKGIADPEALCSRIQKKTMRSVKVISPLPPADHDAPDSTNSQVVASQVSGVTTVELQVRMHCEACAQQLRRKILKMRGVQAAEAELSTGKVSVTGTMTGENLVDYIYKRTGKLASVVPPPPPPPPPKEVEEEKKEEGEKKEEEKPPEEKKEEEEKAEELPDNGKKEEEAKEAKKEDGAEARMEGPENVIGFVSPEEMMMKRMMYWNGGYNMGEEENFGRRVMPWMPVYVIDQPGPPPPPPQMFSDENPNACCIS